MPKYASQRPGTAAAAAVAAVAAVAVAAAAAGAGASPLFRRRRGREDRYGWR